MADFTADDCRFMARALSLAANGRYTAHPNPRVGCVLVKDGVVVGEGWHRRAGEPHAEINALEAAGAAAKGCTAYVSLEPCSHHGRTPPCVDALRTAGVGAVVAAMQDPNPDVSGQGFAALKKAGVRIQVGLMETEAKALNRGFASRCVRGRPWVTVKSAASLDGRTAMAGGESRWITGEAARRDVQRLRASSGAILTGVDTVLADDPALTVRDPDVETGGRQPLRVVLDSRLRTPAGARLLQEGGATHIYCVDDAARAPLEAVDATVIRVPSDGERTSLSAVLESLAALQINDVLVEAGPRLAGSLLAAKLVDELVIYLAPHIMGSETRGLYETPGWRALEARQPLRITDLRQIGEDIRITAAPRN